MYWLYFTHTSPLSWKDEILTDYFREQGIDIRIQAINNNKDNRNFNLGLTASGVEELPERVILSNLCTKEVSKDDDYFYHFFLPMYVAEFCGKHGVHYTFLDESYLRQGDKNHYVQQLLHMKNTLYLNFWLMMNDDIGRTENGLHQLVHHPERFSDREEYHITVTTDIFPIVRDLIGVGKYGHYEMTNPTRVRYSKILSLYAEYMSITIGRNRDVDENDDESIIRHSLADTSLLESEYFILPSYQALQRLIKRIRKSSMIHKNVSLNKKCNILVTGGFGFIGSNLVHYLYHQFPKCQIVNIDRLDYCSRRENLEDLLSSERVKCYEVDLCETMKIQRILFDHNIDFIFHLAAQSHVDNSFNNSLQFSRDNMYGTHSLLEACKNYGKIIRFLHVSTDEIYGETLQMIPFAEDVLPNPTNPYAATKVGAEYIVKSYFHCFELPIIIVRGNNVYGPRQFPEKMIPRFITSILQGNPCTVAGNGLMQRNFIHVEDVCRGLVCVMEHGVIDQIYNIGSDDEKSVLSIAKMIIRTMTGVSHEQDIAKHITYVKDRYYNDFRYSIDSRKIRLLGWNPKITFDEGLQRTIQYYTENLELYQSEDDDSSTSQSDEHINLASVSL